MGWLMAIVLMAVVSFALTALGFCIAWRMSSTQGFHAIMNLFLMPMWFLSGALFPASGAWGPLGIVMALNPLTYGLAGLRRAMYWGDGSVNAAAHLPSMALCVVISVAFAATLFLLASLVARRTTAADLQ
jgi:ABC-2 type transport system permease protein